MTKIYDFFLFIHTYIDVALFHHWSAVDDRWKARATR